MSKAVIVAVITLAIAVPVLAGDIVTMPTGNMVSQGNFEVNGIYWNRPNDMDVTVGELFYGVTDWLEVDMWYADVDNADSYYQANVYARLIPETATHPSLIVGATNITGEDWIGGTQFMRDIGAPVAGANTDMDDPSFFVLGSYNLAVPAVPTWKTPLVRAHLGWGDNQSMNELFGGLQLKFTPRIGAAILNYASQPAYMATVNVTDSIEATLGSLDGDTFYRVGGFWSW